jgi:hypothetical protein
MKTVIFDLDGTLALIDERRNRASKPRGKMDFSILFDPELIKLDKPNVPVIETFKLFKEAGYNMVIFSGRGKETEEATHAWLSDYGVTADLVMMREIRDYRPDDVLKLKWLNKLFPDRSEVFAIFDDRNKVVDMWRKEGLTCFQVENGDF